MKRELSDSLGKQKHANHKNGVYVIIDIMGAFHLGKKPGNFGGSESGISDW